MQKIFIALLMLLLHIEAKEIDVSYKITFGIIGEIGVASAKFVTKDDTYLITLEAKTTGIAKSLSGNRKEFFKSEGRVLANGDLLPLKYEHIVTRQKKRSGFVLDISKWKKEEHKSTKIFVFNHEKKEVKKQKIKSKGGKVYSKNVEVEPYYAPNDLLSLFFNFKAITQNFQLKKPIKLYAMGANKKDGRVDVMPVSEALKEEIFGLKAAHIFLAAINQPIFASKNGELFVKLDDDGLCMQALLKDVLFFGDIKGEMIEKHIH